MSFVVIAISCIYNPFGTGMDESLDLNLGIAPPLASESPNDNINLRSFPFHLGCNDIPIHMRVRVILRSIKHPPLQELSSAFRFFRTHSLRIYIYISHLTTQVIKLLTSKHFVPLYRMRALFQHL